MQTSSKPRQIEGVVRQELESEAVLYHAATGKIHILNKTAECLWELCDGNHSLSDMEADLRARFQIPDEAPVANDVAETLEQFATNGLVSVEDSD